ncbi:Vitamin K epoxide reductase family, putative [Trypanosoma equiperdum]|uniref:vitamin-K-epoxide reductase (warfarin-sensitive) n=1 Tax=Trypanosoma equiperdum TaxID=5694 RepID=A0A1G4I4Z0_TRYEQ|nr:Vitamin K epoxide reductase family, putative [Trypanosoma equiperdum]
MLLLSPFLIMTNLLLSCYAYYVELQANRAQRYGDTYRAYCDVGMFSCTRVFTSEYRSISRLVGLPEVSNALLGIAFYMIELMACRCSLLLLWLSACSCVLSVVLLFVLVFILKDLCVVCCSMYAINFITFALAVRWRSQTGRVHVD